MKARKWKTAGGRHAYYLSSDLPGKMAAGLLVTSALTILVRRQTEILRMHEKRRQRWIYRRNHFQLQVNSRVEFLQITFDEYFLYNTVGCGSKSCLPVRCCLFHLSFSLCLLFQPMSNFCGKSKNQTWLEQTGLAIFLDPVWEVVGSGERGWGWTAVLTLNWHLM